MGLALIALPIFLLDSQVVPSPESTPSAPGGQGTPATPVVSLADPGSARPSPLGVFDSKDPFTRSSGLDSGGDGDAVGAGSGTSGGGSLAAGGASLAEGAVAASGSGAGSGVDGSSGLGADSSPPGDDPASGGGAPSPSGGAPGSPGTSSPSSDAPFSPAPDTETRTRTFTYVADVRLGPTDKERTLRDIEAPKLLPSDRSPLIVFLGASSDGESALFMIDTSMLNSTGGKGECKPDSVTCSFLTLSTDGENDLHLFKDNDGARYSLRLLDLRAKSRSGGSSPRGICAPGYSPCLPATGDLDCSDIPSSEKPVQVTGGDPYRLDGDGDGVGCDSG
jgi:hypothetical protein